VKDKAPAQADRDYPEHTTSLIILGSRVSFAEIDKYIIWKLTYLKIFR
jgi:hypothetical protein